MASLQSKFSSTPTTLDDFDTLLSLEDTLYSTAYSQGVSDGAQAGRIEGRIFGLEKGFEKFTSLGQLHGRSVVWGSRVLISNTNTTSPSTTNSNISENKHDEQQDQTKKTEGQTALARPLPPLPTPSSRLTNNITLLHSLTDPETFSTQNTEEAVADFDDRYKRAGAKAKVIERILKEDDAAAGNSGAKSPEDGSPARGKVRNVVLEGKVKGKGKKGDDSMEDFAGSRLLR